MAELEAIERRQASLERSVKHCNRGGELFTTLENGLKRGVSCDAVRSTVAKLDGRREELRAYLDGGLREECRKAGCRPGWIR